MRAVEDPVPMPMDSAEDHLRQRLSLLAYRPTLALRAAPIAAKLHTLAPLPLPSPTPSASQGEEPDASEDDADSFDASDDDTFSVSSSTSSLSNWHVRPSRRRHNLHRRSRWASGVAADAAVAEPKQHRRAPLALDDEEEKDEVSADSANLHKTDPSDVMHLFHTCAMLPLPLPCELPLLQCWTAALDDPIDMLLSDTDASDVIEWNLAVDEILCDPSRLAHTTVVDEDGVPMSSIRPSTSDQAFVANVLMSARAIAATSGRGAVIKSGLLFKQGFGFLHGGWKVRYVELTSTKMTFFREENGRKRGEIDLATCTPKSIEIMPRDSIFDGSQATMWRFAIRTKDRRVLVSAYSEAEMKEWLRCLHVAIAVQHAGVGRYTDVVVPNGTLLAGKGDGLLRSSAMAGR
ncbi:hypothetical protein P43SY_001257 [Pythium insidiosum]|uniref:PH domain-containing protein n=1 Tax=Pythium insidiosum TaxID=114742 RepID=A0AAD5Q5K5_PYTIN|nr:hypothetical protein P43SY_001257 [Pythium insidiosum]